MAACAASCTDASTTKRTEVVEHFAISAVEPYGCGIGSVEETQFTPSMIAMSDREWALWKVERTRFPAHHQQSKSGWRTPAARWCQVDQGSPGRT